MAVEDNEEEIELGLDSLESLEAEALKELGQEDETIEDKQDNNLDEDIQKKDNDSEDEQKDDKKGKIDEQEEEIKPDFKPIEFEIAGQKIVLNSEEELKAMLSKGAESISKQDKSLELESEIIKQGKITADDLKLLIDAKNGDAKAIAKLAKNSNINILDVDEDDADSYVPTFAPNIVSDVERVAREISADTEHAAQFTSIASNLPNDFKTAIMSNANDLKVFSEHVKTGLAQKIIPEAMKLVYTKGMSFSDAYVAVGSDMVKVKEQPKQEERILTDREKELRKKASESGNNQSNGGKKTLTVDDIANMSDEDFEKLTAADLE